MAAKSERLRLLAQDVDDLGIVAAALQDAVARVGDISYAPGLKALTIVFNRFRWERSERAEERVRSALQFGGVLGVQARNIRREASEAVVELLTLEFAPDPTPPGGVVTLSFAGGGDVRLDVECLDAALADLSDPWPARRKPAHRA